MTQTRADSGDKLGVNCNHIQIASNSLLFKKDVSPNKIADRTANLFSLRQPCQAKISQLLQCLL